MTDRVFITSGEVAELLEYDSTNAFLRRRRELEEEHDFPPPVPLLRRGLKWRRSAVEHWKSRQGHAPGEEDSIPALQRGVASGKVSLLQAARQP